MQYMNEWEKQDLFWFIKKICIWKVCFLYFGACNIFQNILKNVKIYIENSIVFFPSHQYLFNIQFVLCILFINIIHIYKYKYRLCVCGYAYLMRQVISIFFTRTDDGLYLYSILNLCRIYAEIYTYNIVILNWIILQFE